MDSGIVCNDSTHTIWTKHIVLALGIAQMVTNLVVIIFNTTVIIAIVLSRDLRERPIFILFCNLALSDMLVSSSGFWIALQFLREPDSTILGSEKLLIPYTLYAVSILSTIYNLVSIAIERYLAVSDSMRLRCRISKKQTLFAAVTNWAVSILLGSLPLMGWNCVEEEDRVSALYGPFCIDYLVFLATPNFAVVLVLPLFAYVGIIVLLRKQEASMEAAGQFIGIYRVAESKVAKTCLFIWVLTIVSYTPFFGGVMWDAVHDSCPQELQGGVFIFRNLSAMMIILNSLGNPIIYTLRLKSVGNNLMLLKWQPSNRIEVQSINNV